MPTKKTSKKAPKVQFEDDSICTEESPRGPMVDRSTQFESTEADLTPKTNVGPAVLDSVKSHSAPRPQFSRCNQALEVVQIEVQPSLPISYFKSTKFMMALNPIQKVSDKIHDKILDE